DGRVGGPSLAGDVERRFAEHRMAVAVDIFGDGQEARRKRRPALSEPFSILVATPVAAGLVHGPMDLTKMLVCYRGKVRPLKDFRARAGGRRSPAPSPSSGRARHSCWRSLPRARP